ncbi:N-acyl-D-amino-acid deacylase family protein [Actinocorallia sp. A-T 12471]|uniref:N-acyl-D-amino-acid deacylase family protein n=1 Tax=Actinocorallia sp. A-T 12471 TaxID=3089813 RepID=UPI0029CC0D88|nr:amidohydrolase family protein [Actinocorallia sp. A-T 12471]MDX6745137.1 amidohydrolase family protein [Actinocorallia sp. A-T 12471]
MHDIVIRGGEVADGTGTPPRRADVAIDGDRVTEVGPGLGRGRREIDADGALVTPGFIDVHTHLDAQLFWDAAATPSCYHGITTVVMGNCGVTFAPVRPGQEGYLAAMMESVEDIPADTIMAGLDWGWESYGDYLKALGRRPLGVNAGGLVGHCALRTYVMGERALEEAPATADDLAAMAALVGEAVEAGALGFSTSRTFMHTVPDGRPVPGTYALPAELAAIADALAARGRGTFQVVPRIGERDGADRANSVAEMAWMEEVSRASGRPLAFSIMQSDRRPGLWSWVMDATAAARSRGADLRPMTAVRGSAIVYGLVSRTPYDALPSWAALMALPIGERLSALDDAALRERLVEEASRPADLKGPLAPKDPAKIYLLPPGTAAYDVSPGNSLAAEAARRGLTPPAAFLAYLRETDGVGLLYYPVLNQDLDAVATMITNPDVVIGVADAGAHVALTMDAGNSTYFLTHWVRDRGLLDVGPAIRKLTKDAASLWGIPDRGTLTPGSYADINVIDLASLELHTPVMLEDFPLNAPRFTQRARGYLHTLVNGEPLINHDTLTPALPGRLITPA